MENKDNEKKKVDPGWNDPPMLNYSPSNPPPKSRITNKRVPFPMAVPTAGTSSSPPVPPGPNIKPLLLPPLFMSEKEFSEELFKTTKDNLGKFILTHKSQKTKESIHLLYKLWEEGKFSSECQKNIYLLSQCLSDNDAATANVVKERLLDQFKDSCEDWLVNFVI